MPDHHPLLRVSSLTKSYSKGAKALAGVDFSLEAGEVHALVGENGAGKSTFSRIVAGLERADAGEMRLRGEAYAPRTRREAENRGVRIVMQELNLIGSLSVAEAIFIDRLPHRYGVIDYRRLNEEARAVMGIVGLGGLDPTQRVHSLGVGQQQLVEIAAAVARRSEVLILDEPTAALTGQEVELLFARIAELSAAGVGVIYISHRMEEIRRIADRVTALRDGATVGTRSARTTTVDEIIKLMVGRELPARHAAAGQRKEEVALRVDGLRRGAAVRGVSFTLFRGEILGFAGLMGSGRTETMRAIFGADRPEAGRVFVGSATTPLVIREPGDAVRAGIAFLTEDRQGQGVLLSLSIRANISLTRLRDVALGGWFLRATRERPVALELAKRLGVRCTSVEQRVGELSGGNQQKVVIAKWIFRDCDILIFDEPTRGIDVGAKFEIYRQLEELAGSGKAIVIVSSELPELIGLCDRIAVISAGAIVKTFDRDQFDQDAIMSAALSGYGKKAAEEERA